MAVGIEEVLLPEEQLSGRAFTDEDRELLRSYGGLIEGLADLFGKHCEVVLHSLENLHESVIQIANGFNTGRTLGAPITDLALRMLKDIESTGQDHTQSYFARSRTGALMKSSTIAIRNRDKTQSGIGWPNRASIKVRRRVCMACLPFSRPFSSPRCSPRSSAT